MAQIVNVPLSESTFRQLDEELTLLKGLQNAFEVVEMVIKAPTMVVKLTI